MEQEEVDALYKDWKRAVRRSLDWEEAPEGDDVF